MQSNDYYATPPPRKSKVGVIIAIVAGVLAVCCVLPCGLLGYVGMNSVGKFTGYIGCGMTMEEMRDGLLAYAKAHNGTLPQAARWQEDISRYVTPLPSTGKFKMPPMDGDVCDMDAGTSFIYNSAIAGKKLKDVKQPEATIAIWETYGKGRNVAQSFKPLDPEGGPKLIFNVHRGLIEAPLSGAPFYLGRHGGKQNIPKLTSTDNGSVKVETDSTNHS